MKMTMGLKVRRVLEEDIKKKAKKRKEESDDIMESVYHKVMGSFKSWATRRMREASVIDADIQPWAERGSRKYLWKPEQVEAACRYVLVDQSADPSRRSAAE